MARKNLSLLVSMLVAGSALLALTPGCATITVDGHEVEPLAWERESSRVRNEAGFLFKCPSEELELKILETVPDISGEIPVVIGVSGCGDTAVYKRFDGRWVLDGARSGGG
jgi:hypothetical protein